MFVLALITIVIAKSTIPSTIHFYVLTDNLRFVVESAQKTGWTEELSKDYQEGLSAIEDFSKENYFNKFLVSSGSSTTGKITRLIVVVFVITVVLFNIMLFLYSLSNNYKKSLKILRNK